MQSSITYTKDQAIATAIKLIPNASTEAILSTLSALDNSRVSFIVENTIVSYPFNEYVEWLRENNFVAIEVYDPQTYHYEVNGKIHSEENFLTEHYAQRDAFYTYVVIPDAE